MGSKPAAGQTGNNRDAALALSYFCGGIINHPLRVPTSSMTPAEIWGRSNRALAELLKLSDRDAKLLAVFRSGFSPGRRQADLKKLGIGFVAFGEADYPESLLNIHDPPAGLFVAGAARQSGRKSPAADRCAGSEKQTAKEAGEFSQDVRAIHRLQELLAGHRIAIVGARAASPYGFDVTARLGAGLSRRSVCIISGMAMGVDAAAHRAAIENSGRTVAVLGGGVDQASPRVNYPLYRSLLKCGAVISEYPPGTIPLPWRFPARNRIIAGLSEGVVVIEAKEKSGALITADYCLEQGKEVFAVPGSIFSELSTGPNELIKTGAVPATRAADVLDFLGVAPDVDAGGAAAAVRHGLSQDERLIYGVLDAEYNQQDVLAARSGLDISRAAAALVLLEIKRLAQHDQQRGFSRIRK
ncbi:MAG: DNA-processing protein DprA [Actinobacteria bacterium]|nr:DNA-processing protein DprA [Actinomycetota bacterium]